MVALKGSVPPLAKATNDKGSADATMKLPYVTMFFQPTTAQQAALKKLLTDQQDSASPSYHKWLTPEQYGEQFGLSANDIAKIKAWLGSQGLHVVEVARGKNWIAFSGTIAQIQQAFHTKIDRFEVDGEERFANASEISIPKALQGIVSGFRGLNNFKLKPMVIKSQKVKEPYYYNSNNYLAPDDIATIYDIGPLYTGGFDGTGMTVAVMEQSDVHSTDISDFQFYFGLSGPTPQYVLGTGCSDPGYTVDEGEADVDIEWSGATARKAQIISVICDTTVNNGVFTSLQYSISNNTAPVLSMSYGDCEANIGSSTLTGFYEPLIQQANLQGQTVIVSSGDSGAANCDPSGSSQAVGGLAVNGLASPSEVTAAGGTEFNEGSGTYWSTTNGTNGGSALSYIPELGWNDSSAGTDIIGVLAATGGGTSTVFLRPSWQTGTGTFDPTYRSVPDISFTASPVHDPYIYCTNLAPVGSYTESCASGIQQAIANGSIAGGTSFSAPVFAGMVALLNQYLGNVPPAGLGNIDAGLYQYAAKSASAFHDTPAGPYNIGFATNASSNIVPCAQGSPNCSNTAPYQFTSFLTGTGYDQVTGLGSIDANVFVTNWAANFTPTATTMLSVIPTTATVGTTSPVSLGAQVTSNSGMGTPTGTVTFYNGTTQLQQVTLTNGTANYQYPVSTLAVGAYSITAAYSGDSTFAASTSAAVTLNVILNPTTTGGTVNPASVGATTTTPVTLSASVTPGSGNGTPTGTMTFYNGTTQLGHVPLANGAASLSYNISALTVNSYSITATYSGDSTFAPSTSPAAPLNVTLNATTVSQTVAGTPSATESNVGSPITFTATVAHTTGSAAPTGSVSFTYAGGTVGTATLNGSGVATYSTSKLAVGQYGVTGTYNGDANYATSNSQPSSVDVVDFQINPSSTTVTVSAPGQSGKVALKIAPQSNFTEALTYSCSGLPSGATCSFTSGGTNTENLTINTTGPTARLERELERSQRLFYAMLMPGFLGLFTIPGVRKKTKWRFVALFLVLALGLMWLPACGGGSSSSNNNGNGGGTGGTPTGSSTITVTASTSGSNALSHSVKLTLTVQ